MIHLSFCLWHVMHESEEICGELHYELLADVTDNNKLCESTVWAGKKSVYTTT